MRELWEDSCKFSVWLEVEILVCEAMARLGLIPEADAKVIRARGKFSVSEIREIEKRTNHDVIAFLENVASHIGPEARWVH
jgi:adenylosuccinate lyase